MTESLPDEILSAILHFALTIPTEIFEQFRTHYTFATTPRSPTLAIDILQVSKRWHELGLPSLYESAILRTTTQADKLLHVLQSTGLTGCTDPGRYMRRLRVEAGYSRLAAVLIACPKVGILYLGLNIGKEDKTSSDLLAAMQTINPSRLLFDDLRIPWSQADRNCGRLLDTLARVVPCWTNLRRVDFSPEFSIWHRAEPILKQSKTIEHIGLFMHPPGTCVYQPRTLGVGIWGRFTEYPSVKIVQLRNCPWVRRVSELRVHQSLENVWVGEDDGMFRLQEVPHHDGLDECLGTILPELPDSMWSRIFNFATDVTVNDDLAMDKQHFYDRVLLEVNLTRRSLVLVSKHFHRLALPYLYGSPHLPCYNTPQYVRQFVEQIYASSAAASLVRSLYILTTPYIYGPGCTIPGPMEITVPLPNLVRVHRAFSVFAALATTPVTDAPRIAIEWMAQELAGITVVPSTFNKLTRLRTLILYDGDTDASTTGEVLVSALPQLEVLHLWRCRSSLISAFRAMNLPSLREFGADNDPAALELLSIHGRKLKRLILGDSDRREPVASAASADILPLLDVCPNVMEVHITAGTLLSSRPVTQCLDPLPVSNPHLAVEVLVVIFIGDRSQFNPDPIWQAIVAYVTDCKSFLPALDEVRADFERWPCIESLYRSSETAKAAYDLYRMGIGFGDIAGRRWRRFDPVTDVKRRKQRS